MSYTTLSFSDEQILKHINPLLKIKPMRKVQIASIPVTQEANRVDWVRNPPESHMKSEPNKIKITETNAKKLS